MTFLFQQAKINAVLQFYVNFHISNSEKQIDWLHRAINKYQGITYTYMGPESSLVN